MGKRKPGSDRSLDEFSGAEPLRRLSARLMDWYEDDVTDAEISQALGDDAVEPFRYAQERLSGRVRRVTLEPAFCHSADVALRTRGMGYGSHAITVALLHDVVEDCSRNIADAPRELDALTRQFSSSVTRDVKLLTNRYSLIFKALSAKVRRDVPFDERAIAAYRAALAVVHNELPLSIAERFAPEFERLAKFFDERAELQTWARIAERDRKFAVSIALQRQIYGVYAEELVESAIPKDGVLTDTALAVKYVDLTDNVRTTELSARLSMFKLLNKAEAVLDGTAVHLLDALEESGLARHTTIPEWRPLVAARLVDQLDARRRAVADNFAETRFSSLVGFLSEQIARLTRKYEVPEDRVPHIQKLTQAILAKNDIHPE